VVIDDIGYGDLGCYGSKLHRTPNIDGLAADGMRFTDFHTNGAVCSPTRAALMTGQYQQRSGVETAIGFNLTQGMPQAKTTIAEVLGSAGYACGVFGKWHLGHVSLFGPNAQGFQDTHVSNNSPDYHTHVSREGELDWYDNGTLDDEPGYLTDLVTAHTLDFLQTNRGRPFFAFVSHVAAHFPFQGPSDPPQRSLGRTWHDEKYGPLAKSEYRRAYRDMIEAVDVSVGRIMQELDRLGLRDHTLVFITSDNGAYSWVGSNAPFQGQKGDLFEGGHRVPGIANWPGHVPAGATTGATVLTMDLLPTFLSLARAERPAGLEFDGLDVSSVLLQNEPLAERTVFWRMLDAKAARRGPWKLLVRGESAQLFNLADDPGEQHDLASHEPEIRRQLHDALNAWQRDVVANDEPAATPPSNRTRL